MSMTSKRQISPSICPPAGTYIISHYDDGSLELMRVLTKPRIHPARILKTRITHHIPEWWDLPVEDANNPEPTKGKCYLSDGVVESIRPATDDDFKAFILEQKQSLNDIRYAEPMSEWYRTGIITAYKWWKDYRKQKGLQPIPPFDAIALGSHRSLNISEGVT